MGEAILAGLLAAGKLAASAIVVAEPDAAAGWSCTTPAFLANGTITAGFNPESTALAPAYAEASAHFATIGGAVAAPEPAPSGDHDGLGALPGDLVGHVERAAGGAADLARALAAIVDLLGPPLTSVVQPIDELGRLGAERLISMIGGADPAPDLLRLPVRVVERASVAPPREQGAR